MGSQFHVKECTVAPIATGLVAHTLHGFRDQIAKIHAGSIDFHFWRGRLVTSFHEDEHPNDFCYWAREGLHDSVLSEHLEMINPADYQNVEEVRQAILTAIDHRIADKEPTLASYPFHFVRSSLVVYDTGINFNAPQDLKTRFQSLNRSSIFYHFIEAYRRSSERVNDFSSWLQEFGGDYAHVAHRLNVIDPYFTPLSDLQKKIATIINHSM